MIQAEERVRSRAGTWGKVALPKCLPMSIRWVQGHPPTWESRSGKQHLGVSSGIQSESELPWKSQRMASSAVQGQSGGLPRVLKVEVDYAREQQREQHMQSSGSMTEQDTSRHGMKSYNRRAGDAVGGKVGLRVKVLEVHTEESAFYSEDSGV